MCASEVSYSATITVALCALICGCGDRSGPPVKYILPNGFTGYFRIVEDNTSEVTIKLESGAYVYRIPSSGVLVINELPGKDYYHSFSAQYVNGQTIPLGVDDRTAPSTLAYYSLSSISTSSSQKREHWYLVGTKKERDAFYRDEPWNLEQ